MESERGGRPVVPVTEQHRALSEFTGDWDAVERVFIAPGSEPIERKGRTSHRTVLDGRVALMESELTNPDGTAYGSIVIATWNVNKASFEGIFMDVHSFDGFDPMSGSSIKKPDQTGALRPDESVKRTWAGSITVPRMGQLAPGAPQQLFGVDRRPVQLIEQKYDDNRWVLLGIMTDAQGNEFVGLEWTFTRATGKA